MFKSILITFILPFILSIPYVALTQQKYVLELTCVDKGSTEAEDIIGRKMEFSAKQACEEYVQKEFLAKLQKKGYLAASIDRPSSKKKDTWPLQLIV